MIETTKLILISAGVTLTFIQGQSLIRNQKLLFVFPQIWVLILNQIQVIAITFWFVEAHAKFILHKFCSRENSADRIW